MSTARRIRRRRGRKDHAKALAEVGLWEKDLQHHWHVIVRRLVMAEVPRRKAELMAYKAIVAGMAGMDLEEMSRRIAEGDA